MTKLRFLIIPLALLFIAAAKKPAIAVRCHVEANARDGEVFAMPVRFQHPPREGHVERVASISERDIRAIYPTNPGDGSFGCAFMLTSHGRMTLQTFSTQRRGSSLMIFVNTKAGSHQVIDMVIDKPITDGVIYVPRGLTELEIAALQKHFPTAGQPAKRK